MKQYALSAALMSGALLVGACGSGDVDSTSPASSDAPPRSSTSSTTAVRDEPLTTSSSSTSTTAAEEFDNTRSPDTCESDLGFRVDVPDGWVVNDDCSGFNPEPFDDPAPNTDERSAAIVAYVDPVSLERVAESEDTVEETTVGGHDAIRVVSTDSEFYPEGSTQIYYAVDVGGSDGEPKTLFLHFVDLETPRDAGETALDSLAESLMF